jgi:hypothetical protein
LIVEFGADAFHVAHGGLSGSDWALSICLGLGVYPVQQVINFVYRIGLRYKKGWRSAPRLKRESSFLTRNAVVADDGGRVARASECGGEKQ